MKITFSILAFLFVVNLQTSAQIQQDGNNYYLENFKWHITVPDDFETVAPGEWDAMKNTDEMTVEDSTGEKVANQAKTVFVFRNGDFNYFESNWQSFDPSKDGSYRESCKAVNEVLYETFKAQIPEAVVDTSSTSQLISGLFFQKFVVKMKLPNGIELRSYMFSRLFDDREFSANMLFVDGEQGERMMNAWLNSTFD